MHLFHRYWQTNSRVYAEGQNTQNCQRKSEEEKVGRLTLLHFKSYYKSCSDQDTDERNQRWQTDGEIYHVLGLEEPILWKWLYYPKQSTDSVQSLSNY